MPPNTPPEVVEFVEALQRQIDAMYNTIRMLQNELENRPNQPPPVPQAPLLRLINPTSIVVMPGEEIDVTITVRNIGTGTAQSIITHAAAGAAPFLMEFRNNTNNVHSMIQNAQRHMTLRITVDENAEPGNHAITLNHHFRNTAGESTTTTDTINVRIGGEVGVSNVRLSNFRTSVSTLGADQTFTVTADLQNMGSLPANNVQVSVGNLSASTVFLTSDISQNFFSVLDAGETRTVSFTFQTSPNITSNVYQLDFRLTYDDSGERAAIPFFVTVLADYATESANIEMRGLTATTSRLNVSQTGQISFELVNTGDAVAQNVIVTATSTDPAALVPTMSNRQSVQSLAVDAARTFEFGFMPTANAQTQSYAIQLRVEYEIRGTEASSSFVQYVALNVYNPEVGPTPPPETGATQIPRVIVSAFNVEPQIPRAGQNFDLEITFLNTSPTRSVNNIRIEFHSAIGEQGAGAVFTPAGGSNTLFIGFLGPEEYITKVIPMFTVPDAAPRIYTLDVEFEYQDQDYAEHRTTNRLSIPVAQFSRLETDPPELFVPPFMDIFGFHDVEFQIINSGRVPLRNMRVRIDGPFDPSEANVFMATLADGRTNTYRGRIRPLEEGLLEGAFVIYGEDSAGAIVELVHAFTIEVTGGFGGDGDFGFDDRFPGSPGFPGDDGFFEGGAFDRPGFGDWDDPWADGEDEGLFARIAAFVRRPLFWGPAAGVVVAAIIVVVILVNRKRSKLSFDDDGFN